VKELKEGNEDKVFFLIRFHVGWNIDKVELYPYPNVPDIKDCVEEDHRMQNLGHRG